MADLHVFAGVIVRGCVGVCTAVPLGAAGIYSYVEASVPKKPGLGWILHDYLARLDLV